MSNIEIIENVNTDFTDWVSLKSWVESTIHLEGYSLGELNFVFMSDESLLEYNKDFLDHDYFTDIITFDNNELDKVNGDILISVDRIYDNSKTLDNKYLDEFCRVVIHGVLHLCGYKDKSVEDEKMMRYKENEHLEKRSFT